MIQAPAELPSSLALYAFGALQLITTAGVTWVVKTVYRLDKSMVKVDGRLDAMRVSVYGETGQNGLNGEVKGLRRRMHDAENDIHGLKGVRDLHEQRLNRLDPEGA